MNRRLFAGLACIALAAGCSGDPVTAPLDDVAGTYTLRTVNGSAVPMTLGPTPTGSVGLVSGVLTVNPNSTFTYTLTLSETVGTTSTNTTQSSSGTWTRSSSTLSFKGSDGSTTTAHYADNSLTIVASGVSFVYRKQ